MSTHLMGRQKSYSHDQQGFTLVEIMAVVIILAVLAAIAIPRFTSSVEKARQNADVATGHQVKTALDRYQLENGIYPKLTDLGSEEGKISDENEIFIPAYISALNPSVTQQTPGSAMQKGFGVEELPSSGDPATPTYLVTIYLTDDGANAAVRVVDGRANVLWSSLDE